MIIYAARNKLNNRVYVGRTMHSLGHRKKEHLRQKLEYPFALDLHKIGAEQAEICESLNVHKAQISKHLKGKLKGIRGMTFSLGG